MKTKISLSDFVESEVKKTVRTHRPILIGLWILFTLLIVVYHSWNDVDSHVQAAMPMFSEALTVGDHMQMNRIALSLIQAGHIESLEVRLRGDNRVIFAQKGNSANAFPFFLKVKKPKAVQKNSQDDQSFDISMVIKIPFFYMLLYFSMSGLILMSLAEFYFYRGLQSIGKKISSPVLDLTEKISNVDVGSIYSKGVFIEATTPIDEINTLKISISELLQKLGASRSELEKSLEKVARGAVAEQVAHDIKTPLMALKVCCRPGSLGAQRKLLETSVDRIEKIINTLRENNSNYKHQSKLSSVSGLLDHIVSLKEVAAASMVQLTVAVSEEQIKNRKILIDPLTVKRIFDNLVSNALGPKVGAQSLKVSFDLEGSYVSIKLIDDGNGIDPKNLKNLFKPGFSTKGSTGMGLAYVKEQLSQNGGSISCSSKIGGGSCFTIKIKAGELSLEA